MAIRFTIAKRGVLPNEKAEQEQGAMAEEPGGKTTSISPSLANAGSLEDLPLKALRPRLEHRQTVDAVEFQDGDSRLPSMLPKGELISALEVLHRVMVHEMEKGNAVQLPGLGTFRLSVKGDIEVKDGYLHGKNVHVDGLLFEPDRKLLREVCDIEVNQVPYGQMIHAQDDEVEQRLVALFAEKDTITNQDVYYAFGLLLTRHRVTSLLSRLVREGKLIREGSGSQTRYRQAKP